MNLYLMPIAENKDILNSMVLAQLNNLNFWFIHLVLNLLLEKSEVQVNVSLFSAIGINRWGLDQLVYKIRVFRVLV